MKLLLRLLIPIVVLIGAGYVMYSLIDSRPPPPTRVAEPVLPLVETIEAVYGDVALRVRAEGPVAPRVETELVTEVAMISRWYSPGGTISRVLTDRVPSGRGRDTSVVGSARVNTSLPKPTSPTRASCIWSPCWRS